MTLWVDTLAKVAESRWIDKKPLYLAEVPSLLREKSIDISDVRAGRSLRSAIATDATDRLRLVAHPDHSLVWAVIPSSAPENIDLRAIFSRVPSQRIDAEAPSQPLQYKRWFWAAFIKSLAPGMKRWILSDQFIDRPEFDYGHSDALEVTVQDIIQHEAGAPTDSAAVWGSIRAWATRTGTNLAEFEVRLTEQPARKVTYHKPSLAFESLDEDDLKRILVPLDIIMKLLRR